MADYTIIDVDTHVTETADLWTSRVPAHMRDAVPRVDQDARGRYLWYLLAVRTGLRRAEMQRLTWSDVEQRIHDRRLEWVRNSKSSPPKVLGFEQFEK